MNIEQALSVADAFFRDGNLQSGMTTLVGVLAPCAAHPESREALLAWVVARLGHPDPEFGAHIAVVGGALVEQGASALVLGRALIAPVEKSLVDARRLLDRVAALPAARLS